MRSRSTRGRFPRRRKKMLWRKTRPVSRGVSRIWTLLV